MFQEALREYGDTPIKIQTATGKFHAWYRHNGETRRIRPVDGLEADILGANGFCVIPPSERPGKGSYAFLEGSPKDLIRLPVMRGGERFRKHEPATSSKAQILLAPNPDAILEGQRDKFIFREARIVAKLASGPEAIYDHISKVNSERCRPPLPDAVISDKARHVWDMKERGAIILPGEKAAVLRLDAITGLSSNPSAFVLWSYLKAHHAPNHKFFIVPEGISGNGLNMSARTIWNARKILVKNGFLKCVRQTQGGGKANLYRFQATM